MKAGMLRHSVSWSQRILSLAECSINLKTVDKSPDVRPSVTFQSILQKYRSDSYSERDKGARFEELISRYLMTDPAYSSTLEKVWVWSSFPSCSDFGGRDTGIDPVLPIITVSVETMMIVDNLPKLDFSDTSADHSEGDGSS